MLKKYQVFTFLAFFLGIISGYAQPESLLLQADSLFEAGKFTTAFKHYDSIFKQNQYTPRMLWRMAYIKESSGQYADALVYLNLCYHYEPNPFVLQKMSEIAEDKKVKGFQISDTEYIYAFYREYNTLILAGVWFIFACWLYVIYRLWRKKEPILFRIVIFTVLLVAVVVLVNVGLRLEHGIVVADEAYLMSAPSAGAKLIGALPKGNRLRILGQEDIWLKTESAESDSVYYIRKYQIHRIP